MADMNEGLDSPREQLAGDNDDNYSNDMPLIGSQNRQRNRDGIISKPKNKRSDLDNKRNEMEK
jgi:hypothetical protein